MSRHAWNARDEVCTCGWVWDAGTTPSQHVRESNAPRCHECERVLTEGEQAWASDWTVITPEGPRLETRYMCDECEAAA